MKKTFLFVAIILLWAVSVFGATPGSVVQSMAGYGPSVQVVKFVVTSGDAGAMPTTAISTSYMNTLKAGGYYLYNVKAYPTSGGTAPDAADITVIMNGLDLLGGKGANLLHATATQDTFPYSTVMSSWRYPLVNNTITVALANHSTNTAHFTFEFVFVK
jgi:hypothetical protein